MKRILCGLVAGALMAMSAYADVLKLKEGHPDKYVVVRGDTLWDISGRFLDSPWLWPEVWNMNPEIENPHLIYPGDMIYLTWVDGRPRLNLSRGMTANGVRKMTPQAKVLPLDQAIPAIPLKDIIAFLTDNLVLQEDVLEESAYIVAGGDRRIISGAGDRVYARGQKTSPDRYQAIYRPAQEYTDPHTQEFLGYELKKIADVAVQARNADVMTLSLRKSTEEVRVLDRVLPTEEGRVQSVFHPAPAPADADGTILSVLDGVSKIGQFDVIAVNLGRREEVAPGQVLAVMTKGERLKDPVTNEWIELPDERSGLVMVFKTFDKVSYGLVLHATRVMSVGDRLIAP